VQAAVPDGHNELGIGDGQGTGQVDSPGATQSMGTGQLAGVVFHCCAQLDRPNGDPVMFPGLFGRFEVVLAEIVVAAGGGEGGTDFRVGQAAGQGGVAAIPEFGGQAAAALLHDELDQGAGVEVDESHGQRRWSLT
jgi:hypothetical protein